MVGAFLQNRVTLIGHLMISLSKSDLPWRVLLCTPRRSAIVFHRHGITLLIGLSLSIIVAQLFELFIMKLVSVVTS